MRVVVVHLIQPDRNSDNRAEQQNLESGVQAGMFESPLPLRNQLKGSFVRTEIREV